MGNNNFNAFWENGEVVNNSDAVLEERNADMDGALNILEDVIPDDRSHLRHDQPCVMELFGDFDDLKSPKVRAKVAEHVLFNGLRAGNAHISDGVADLIIKNHQFTGFCCSFQGGKHI